MANPYEVNQQIHSGMLNGVSGKWVPVVPNEAPACGVSNNPMQPTMGPDGSFYYAEEMPAMYNQPMPIGANMNNAIPTPSNIVQLPPIVQPIAMVPYTTQNQPLVQYDPNYRPPVEETAAPEPAYKRKPYVGISAFVALFALIAIVVASLGHTLAVFKANDIFPQDFSVIEALKWLFAESGMLEGAKAGELTSIFVLGVPVLFGVIMVFCLIVLINALVHIGKMKPLNKVNGWTLAALILAIACVVLMFVKSDIFTIGYGAYGIVICLIVMMILPLFVNKKAQILDYVASKQTYVIK